MNHVTRRTSHLKIHLFISNEKLRRDSDDSRDSPIRFEALIRGLPGSSVLGSRQTSSYYATVSP